MRYGMAIDLKRCMGCQTCMTSCRTANNLPTGNWWNRVITDGGESLDSPDGEYPNCTLQHYPVTCQHCENAPCVEVCPTGATMKDEETGIVTVDAETCIGCKTCMQACPYEVRVYNDGEPKYAMEFAVGFADAPQHVSNTVEKCTMCSNLIARGEKPMCVQAWATPASSVIWMIRTPRCPSSLPSASGSSCFPSRELIRRCTTSSSFSACPTRLMDPSPPPSAKGPFRGWRLAVAPNAIKATSAPGSARFRWRA